MDNQGRKLDTIKHNIPIGLIAWYPFERGKKILCLGEKAEIYAEYLGEKYGEAYISEGMAYDYIIYNGLSGTEKEMRALLARLKSELLPGGIILIATDNRLALRFFCGDWRSDLSCGIDGQENPARSEYNLPVNGGTSLLSMAEWKRAIEAAELKYNFYSVLPDYRNPQIVICEKYFPNEDLSRRITPTYYHPKSVNKFEEYLYSDLQDNHILHELANSYLIECTIDGELSGVRQATVTTERGTELAMATVIGNDGCVEKRALFAEGIKQIDKLYDSQSYLMGHGIKVIPMKKAGESLIMPFYQGKSMQLYMAELLKADKEQFYNELDKYFDVLQSSSACRQTREGLILERGYMDMGFVNCLYKDGQYVFFDQEFYIENCPYDFMKFRVILGFYLLDDSLRQVLPFEEVYAHYGLGDSWHMWLEKEIDFIDGVRNDKLLDLYHCKIRANRLDIKDNKKREILTECERRNVEGDVFHNLANRSLVIFGNGKYAKVFYEKYCKKYKIAYFVDNNPELHGINAYGLPVFGVEKLIELDESKYKLVICVKNYNPIRCQLLKLGVFDASVYIPEKSDIS